MSEQTKAERQRRSREGFQRHLDAKAVKLGELQAEFDLMELRCYEHTNLSELQSVLAYLLKRAGRPE